MDSRSSPSLFDEFEGLEVAEFDPNALWELLHDQPGEEELIGGGGAPMQAMNLDCAKPGTIVESNWCLYNFNINSNNNTVQEIDWIHIVEMETSTSCSEMGGWYGEACMEEMNGVLEIGGCSTSQSEIMGDEIGYIGLWVDDYSPLHNKL